MTKTQWVENELKLAGLFDHDSDYEGLVGASVLELFQVLQKQGHSGASAQRVAELFNRLMQGMPLTPITLDADQWDDQSELAGEPFFQHKRDWSLFSCALRQDNLSRLNSGASAANQRYSSKEAYFKEFVRVCAAH